jgi:hypothetical protein
MNLKRGIAPPPLVVATIRNGKREYDNNKISGLTK